MNQSNASVDMTMYHSVALLAVFCPSFGNDPFEGSAFQASLELPKIRNLQMDHFALIRYVENIPGATPFGNDPFEGSAFQASLDLPKIRNLQMDHF